MRGCQAAGANVLCVAVLGGFSVLLSPPWYGRSRLVLQGWVCGGARAACANVLCVAVLGARGAQRCEVRRVAVASMVVAVVSGARVALPQYLHRGQASWLGS